MKNLIYKMATHWWTLSIHRNEINVMVYSLVSCNDDVMTKKKVSALLTHCEGNPPRPVVYLHKGPVMLSIHAFCTLSLGKFSINIELSMIWDAKNFMHMTSLLCLKSVVTIINLFCKFYFANIHNTPRLIVFKVTQNGVKPFLNETVKKSCFHVDL